MKKRIITLLSILFISLTTFAKGDFEGKWTGTRYQFDESKSKYIAEFNYTYDLHQEGNTITGTAYIQSKGNPDFYANILVRGFVEGNNLFFEEYDIVDQNIGKNSVWCLKKGVLTLDKNESGVTISGKTSSFMYQYGYECTGGFTYLSHESTELTEQDVDKATETPIDEQSLNYNVYPNPFSENTNLSFTLVKESDVTIDVVDVSGKVLKQIRNQHLNAGDYKITYTPEQDMKANYFYIRLFVDGKMYTKAVQRLDYNNFNTNK